MVGEKRSPRLGLIINPRAFKVRTHYLQKRAFWVGCLPEEHIWIPNGINALQKDLEKVCELGADYLAILGGDGTIHMTLSKLIPLWSGSLPTIVPLQGGTINALCGDLGVSTTAEVALAEMMEVLIGRGSPRVVTKHLIHIQDTLGNDRYGFTFANGVMYRGFSDYYRTKTPDAFDAVRATMNVLGSAFLPADSPRNLLKSIPMHVISRGEDLANGPVRVIAVSTLENLVLWFRPFPTELNGQPEFHCLVNRMGAYEIALNAWSLMRGRCRHPGHHVTKTDDLVIKTNEGYLIDGEMFHLSEPMEIRFKLGPAVNFVVSTQHMP